MTRWHIRLQQALDRSGIKAAELARRTGTSPDSVRKWLIGEVDHPRGDKMHKLAAALGVDPVWLRDGIGASRPDDPDLKPAERVSAEETMARIEMGGRIREARIEARLGDPGTAVRGLSISARRWTLIEEGAVAATLVELQVIAERVRRSLDWLVMGYITPVNRPFPLAPDAPADPLRLPAPGATRKRALHEDPPDESPRK